MSKRKRQIRQHKRTVAPGLQAKSVGVHKHASPAKHGTKQSKSPKPEVSAAAYPYTEAQHILCLGEGNFSFARALVRLLEYSGANVIATAFDSKETVLLKYEVHCVLLPQQLLAPRQVHAWHARQQCICSASGGSRSCQ